MVEKSNFRRQNNETIIFDVFCGQVGRPTATERSKLTQLGGKLTPGGSKLARSWLKAGHKQPSKEQRKQLLQLYTLLRGFAKLGGGNGQGGLSEASVRPQGGKGARAGAPYEVLRTTNRSSEDLTRRWARGPANF